ncbi:MAG: KGK domain-containing protein [Phormidium sp.]
MSEEFEILEPNEVVTILEEDDDYLVVLSHNTFRAAEFVVRANKPFSEGIVRNRSGYPSDLSDKWFYTGIDCEILKPGAKNWQKGKVRIRVSLEFCPDEPEIEEESLSNQLGVDPPESPLDDLRRMMNDNSK